MAQPSPGYPPILMFPTLLRMMRRRRKISRDMILPKMDCSSKYSSTMGSTFLIICVPGSDINVVAKDFDQSPCWSANPPSLLSRPLLRICLRVHLNVHTYCSWLIVVFLFSFFFFEPCPTWWHDPQNRHPPRKPSPMMPCYSSLSVCSYLR